ncbi:hypothetical protein HCA46_08795 [Listeria booriae]|uniref:SF3 helicase domain-containing protein n=2 Tax=Listeria booriae TaxID=1552123 RepID=A0A7X1CIE0_9LIST|nr:hypothetical protein [Listeria booriae]
MIGVMLMILFKSKENRQLIRAYITDDFHANLMNTFDFEACHITTIRQELQGLPTNEQASVLKALLEPYELPRFMLLLLKLDDSILEARPKEGIEPTDSLRKGFERCSLEVAQRIIGFDPLEGRTYINRKQFAEFLLTICRLTVSEKNSDRLLIYNAATGRWDDAEIILNRLIIELAHYVGGGERDSWSSVLEKQVMDILLRKAVITSVRKFNQPVYPFANVTLNTNTGKFVAHNPDFMAVMGSPIIYNPLARAPRFERFLNDIFLEDEDVIGFVQTYFGYIFSQGHQSNVLLIGVGNGANGKSTLFNCLEELIGKSYVASVPLNNFNTEFGLEPLIDKKLNLATESDANAFKTGKLKAITAGESISVNRKNKPEITMILPIKLIFLVNELPILTDSSLGFERRLLILPFKRTFTAEQQDKDLQITLLGELSGILNWAVEGLNKLIAQNYCFKIPAALKEASERYFGVGNPVGKFVQERVNPSSGEVIESKLILELYRHWMVQQQLPYKGTDSPRVFWKAFADAMAVAGIEFKKAKSNGRMLVRDVQIDYTIQQEV